LYQGLILFDIFFNTTICEELSEISSMKNNNETMKRAVFGDICILAVNLKDASKLNDIVRNEY